MGLTGSGYCSGMETALRAVVASSSLVPRYSFQATHLRCPSSVALSKWSTSALPAGLGQWGKKMLKNNSVSQWKSRLSAPRGLLMKDLNNNGGTIVQFLERLQSNHETNRLDDPAGALTEPSSISKSSVLYPDNQMSAFVEKDEVWIQMREEARRDSELEPALASYLYSTILAHRSLERALAFHLGNKLASVTFLSTQLFTLIIDTCMGDEDIRSAIRADIIAVKDRDPACVSYSHCLLNFKGYLACQTYRVAHSLWKKGRHSLALALQSRVSEVFHVDIHPAAKIGKGILFDHATGLVVGETADIGDNVSILHHVTLGGTGALGGDRHPKIGDGVLIGAGATLLGPIRVGQGAKIGACSVVMTDIPPHTTAVGNPARLVGGKLGKPAELTDTPSETMDHTSFIQNWSDYVI